jgi:hypothetical protein
MIPLLGSLLARVFGRADGMPGWVSRSTSDLYPPMAERIDRLFLELVGRGYRPVIRETARSPERQAFYVEKGWSQVAQSFHTVTTDDGEPDALAVDCHDGRFDPDDDRQAGFYRALLQAAPKYGLETGGTFTRRGKWAEFGLGWDPGHVQPMGITVAQAHAGQRPWGG